MSSHREAPGIAKDPVADNTDLYAFVSPDKPGTVTILANFIPLEYPPGGPNFFEFGDDVSYAIHISNDTNPDSDITYRFQFKTELRDRSTFLYNTGQILSLDSPNWNRRQFYSVSRTTGGKTKTLATNVPCPPCNVGPRSIPHYAPLASAAVTSLPGGVTVFAGQRSEGFYVDLGSIFDLGDLRPFQNLHLIPTHAADGVDGTRGMSVHTIALQIPKTMLTRDGSRPTDPADPPVPGSGRTRRPPTLSPDAAARADRTRPGPVRAAAQVGPPGWPAVIMSLIPNGLRPDRQARS